MAPGAFAQGAASPTPAPSPVASPFALPSPQPVSSPATSPIPSSSPVAPLTASPSGGPQASTVNTAADADLSQTAPAVAVQKKRSDVPSGAPLTPQIDLSALTNDSTPGNPQTPDVADAAPPQQPASVPSQNLLIIGDSHTCGYFGAALMAKLQTPGRNIDLFCAVSSSALSWVEGVNPKGQVCKTSSTDNPKLTPCGGNGQIPKLADILAAKSYGKAIVALGTNSLGESSVDRNYGEIASEIAAANVSASAWIGPPHLQPDNARGFSKAGLQKMESNLSDFYVSLTKAVGQECSVIDSRPATASGTAGYPTLDGVHRGKIAGGAWAGSLFSTGQ